MGDPGATKFLGDGADTRKMSEAERRALRMAKANLADKFELPCAENFSRCLKERAGSMALSFENSSLGGEDDRERWIIKLGGLPIGTYTIFHPKSGKIPDIEYAGKIPNKENKYVLEAVVLTFSNGERKDDFMEIPFP